MGGCKGLVVINFTRVINTIGVNGKIFPMKDMNASVAPTLMIRTLGPVATSVIKMHRKIFHGEEKTVLYRNGKIHMIVINISEGQEFMEDIQKNHRKHSKIHGKHSKIHGKHSK